MNSRRLDYDFKITAQEKGKCTDDELYAAEDKFNESMQQADTGMKKFVLAEVICFPFLTVHELVWMQLKILSRQQLTILGSFDCFNTI